MSDLGWWYMTRAANRSYPPAPLRIVLHADDFGMNRSVNEGILRGFSHGLLSAASVLANAPATGEALTSWKELTLRHRHGALPSNAARQRLGDDARPFDLGIHLNLTQGKPLTGEKFPADLLDTEGRFPGLFPMFRRLLRLGRKYRVALAAECRAQVESILDHGISPTHLNGHQYVEVMPTVSALVPELMKRFSIPVVRVAWERNLTRNVLLSLRDPLRWVRALILREHAVRFWWRLRHTGITHPSAYFGTAHAGRINIAAVKSFLRGDEQGFIEIGVHPGQKVVDTDAHACRDGWEDLLAEKRFDELEMLTSPELVEFLESRNVRLARLSSLTRHPPLASAA